MLSRGRTQTSSSPPIFPRERIEDGALRGADGKPIERGRVVKNPARYSESLQTEVPSSKGRVTDIYRCNGQELVDVAMDGREGAAGKATFLASRVKRSRARVRTDVEAMPSKQEV